MSARHQWRTREEREESEKRQRIAMYMAMKAKDSQKPARKTTADTDLWKRRDRT